MEENNNEYIELITSVKRLGYEFTTLPSKIQEYLIQINNECNKIINDEKNKHLQSSRKYVSIINISKKIGHSNKTIYNNQLLKDFIELKKKEFCEVDESFIIARLKEENKILKAQVNNAAKRDIEFLEIKNENKELKEELKKKNKELKDFYSGYLN